MHHPQLFNKFKHPRFNVLMVFFFLVAFQTNAVAETVTLDAKENSILISFQADEDGDGVEDNVDACPGTPAGESVDASGCSASQLDDDNDGVSNAVDTCPNTPPGDPADASGCGQTQLDDDNDGVLNFFDI